MRIVMPLFDFEYDGEEFKFTDGVYSLRRFNPDNEIPLDIVGLSKIDIDYIKLEHWAIVADNPKIDKYKQEVNILLLSFKIFTLARAFIKYRFCKENVKVSSKLDEVFRAVIPKKSRRLLSIDDLRKIDEGFLRLLEMSSASNRTYNSLYFIWRGFCVDKWMDSFIFQVCALESLFSKEELGNTVEAISCRVSKFLNSKKGCEKEEVKRLYDIRSNMVHGRIKATYSSDEEKRIKNLDNLFKLEFIVIECMKKFLDEKIYLKFKNVKSKEEYFGTLTK